MIRLDNLLAGHGLKLDDWKIHLATGKDWNDPLEWYLRGRFKRWQEGQTKKNFECKMVVSLIHLEQDRWLFVGVYEILSVREAVTMPYYYRTKLIPGHEALIGRVIVRFKRDFRASYLIGERFVDRLEVAQILDKEYIDPFPGYNKTVIAHERLKSVIAGGDASWRAALANVKGVYLIVDAKTGRMYVGSATGTKGIWQRWCDYAGSGHGGNRELKALLHKKGPNYVRNFQYTVLEIADFHATDRDIVDREQHWKKALLSVEHGYNHS